MHNPNNPIINYLLTMLSNYGSSLKSGRRFLGWGGVIILLLSMNVTFAQALASLSGSVTREQDEPIPGITVLLRGIRQSAIADGLERFSIPAIQSGIYTIEVSGVGFEKQEFQLTFKQGDELIRSIILEKSTVGLMHRMNIKKLQNALTLEIQNLTNSKVFDSFGLQRPGKAFYIKSTIQF
ncbi:MAG: carboxypeptidase-like regulatory domain-containing protein [Bacteroidota bacterium]